MEVNQFSSPFPRLIYIPLSVYTLILQSDRTFQFLLAFALYSSIFLMWIAGLKASVFLHNNLLSNILRGPMNFFESTPTGRVIARFSHDVNTLDERMINNLKQFINTFFRVGVYLIIYSHDHSLGQIFFSQI